MTDVVYFIQGEASGAIKIGHSRNLKARLSSMQTASTEPLKLLGFMPGGEEVESSLHERFADARKRGEWFTATPELLALIASLSTEAEIARAIPFEEDAHTVLADRWIAKLERQEVYANGRTWLEAREIVARRLGFKPGFLENLRRGRIAAISARDYETIRIASLEHCEQLLLTAKETLAQLKAIWAA